MVYGIFGLYERKLREKTYYKEEYERVRECKKESGCDVAPIIGRIESAGGLKGTCRIFAEKINAENCQDNAAYKLDCKLVRIDEACNKTQTETSQQTICQIAERRSDSGKKGRPAPFAEGALNYEHAYRPHRRRDKRANTDTSRQYVKNLLHFINVIAKIHKPQQIPALSGRKY